MPRAYELTYNAQKGRPPRWRKIYKGQLLQWPAGKGKTDQEAYQAALAAWRAKKAEIDAAQDRKHEPEYVKAISEWERVLAWSSQHGEKDWAAKAERKLAGLRRRFAATKLTPLTDADRFAFNVDPFAGPNWRQEMDAILRDTDITQPPGEGTIIQPDLGKMERLEGADARVQAAVWQERLAQGPVAAPVGTSVGDYIDRFLEQKAQQAAARQLSVAQLSSLRTFLGHFGDWQGRPTPIQQVDGESLRGWHAHLLEKIGQGKWSEKTAKHAMVVAKSWVRWLWSKGVLRDLPRVLGTQDLKIEVPDPEIEVFTPKQVKTLLEAATYRTRLFVLLGLNCGYTQKDISDLKPSEVDWELGRIKRKRSKTKTKKKTPLVSYKLWPRTLELLKQERAPEGSDRVLLTEKGGPLLSLRDASGKTVKTDAVRLAFRRLKRTKKIDGGFKLLRKTSASMLADSEMYADLKDLFLGHAAASMADKHYARAAIRRLDLALDWLAEQFGLVGGCGITPPIESVAKAEAPAAKSASDESADEARSHRPGRHAKVAPRRRTASQAPQD